MISLMTLLIVLMVSVLVTKIATVALTHTGLSRESARFQARSAFTGVGFTTSEAEKVVGHPVRRRILMLLMLLGNAGIVTVISSLLLTFLQVDEGEYSRLIRLVIILLSIFGLWSFAASRWVDRTIARLVGRALERFTRLEVRDYASLLHLSGEYRVEELKVEEGDWLAGRSLGELALTKEGVLVLGIQRRNGRYVGAPVKETEIKAGDLLILYGRQASVADLDERRAGHQGEDRHREAVERQQQLVEEQQAQERQVQVE